MPIYIIISASGKYYFLIYFLFHNNFIHFKIKNHEND